LFSSAELREARVKESQEEEARLATLFAAYEAKGFVTFNEQLKYMWDKDPPPTIIDGDGGVHHEKMIALAFGTLLADDVPDPSTYKQATDVKNPDKVQWEASIARERAMLEQR
jgi:hypothetical protein